jgi:hypothetical protein
MEWEKVGLSEVMKHGVRIPKEKRDAMAVRAYELYLSRRWTSLNQALFAIEIELEISHPTARNLLHRGRRVVRARA